MCLERHEMSFYAAFDLEDLFDAVLVTHIFISLFLYFNTQNCKFSVVSRILIAITHLSC